MRTTPEAAAKIGVPAGATMSKPLWFGRFAGRKRLYEAYVKFVTGQRTSPEPGAVIERFIRNAPRFGDAAAAAAAALARAAAASSAFFVAISSGVVAEYEPRSSCSDVASEATTSDCASSAATCWSVTAASAGECHAP